MLAQNHLLNKAISFYRSGNCEMSRQLLLGILSSNETNQAAWIWYAETYSDPEERIRIYQEALTKHPEMEDIRRALQRLQQMRQQKQMNRDGSAYIPTTKPQQGRWQTQVEPRIQQSHAKSNGNSGSGHSTIPAAHPAAAPKAPQTARNLDWGRLVWLIFTALLVIAMLFGSLFVGVQVAQANKDATLLQDQYNKLHSDFTRVQKDLASTLAEYQKVKGQFETATAENASLKSQLESLAQRYNALTAEFQKLQGEFNTLNDNYASLTSENQLLQGKFQALTDSFNNLTAQHDKLASEHQSLTETYNSLNNQYQELQNRYAALERNYNDLVSRQGVPPYLTVADGKVTLAYYKTDHSIGYLTIPLDSLKKDVERGYDSRRPSFFNPTPVVRLTAGDGEEYSVVDYRPFVNASEFAPKMTELYRQSGSDEAFIREVWNLVAQLHIYDAEIGSDIPRYPMETILGGGGDHADLSILFASLIKAAPTTWTVKLVYMNEGRPNEIIKPNHVLVQINTSSNIYLVETTSKTNMTPYPKGVAGWFLDL